MDPFFFLFDLVIHFDKYLPGIIDTYGFWTYLILFAIIFCETGLVVMPYLPGDSLLVTLIAAAVLGDTANYWIGHTFGMKVLEKKYCMIRRSHLEKTEEFFIRYGGATIVIARFVPFIRTFAPFLAGVGKMRYRWFLMYNVIGGVMWILAFVLAGYFFGSIPIVQQNFNYVIYAIIGLSLLAVASIVVGVFRSFSPCPVREPEITEKRD
jgi:membrane-associated protein